ncbi:YcdB/YcdC domain-containing protein [Geosporobacter ferrireducens]|nr:YcdB/YcdC domain-containing protein [Geosporobacter ferrireducens]
MMVKRKSLVFVLATAMVAGPTLPAFADQPATAVEMTRAVTTRNAVAGPVNVTITGVEEVKNAAAVSDEKADISKEKALEAGKKALKDYFGITVEDKKYQTSTEYRKDWNSPDRYVWAMNWNYNDHMEYFYAGITIDANTGEILEMNKDGGKYNEQGAKVTTITREEAQKKAEEFAKKIVPGILEQTKLMDNYDDYYRDMYGGSYPVFYNFNYQRVHEGTKYDANYINVGIDGATGEVRNFGYRWDKSLPNLPKKDGIKSVEEATKIYRDNMNMELIYFPIRDQFRYEPVPKSVKLAYRATYNFADMVDAKTGKMIGWNGKEQDQQVKFASLTEKQIDDIYKKAKPIVKRDKELTKEEAEKAAAAVLKAEFGDGVKINSTNYVEGDGYWESAGRKAWNIEFSMENKDSKATDAKLGIMPMNGRVMIDAVTEEILALNNWQYYEGPYGQSFEPALTWEEAYAKAVEMIEKYHPGKIKSVRTEQANVVYQEMVDGKVIPPMEYYFTFPRKVNGAIYEENQISISFNNRTGKVQYFNARWQEDLRFPSTGQAISKDAAKDTLFKVNELELAYYRFNTNNDYQNPVFDTKLVYRIAPKKAPYNPYMMIDAVSGNMMDYNGKTIPIDAVNDFDSLIKGHWIERSAKLLAQQGIIDKNTFKPDAELSKLEAVKMLVKARGMDYYYPVKEAADKLKFSDVSEDSDDYRFIHMAMRYGIIENKEGKFDGDAAVNREELAVMMVKMLKYDALAQGKDIFNVFFKDQGDITPEYVGYVAICKGLGLLGEDTNFRPKDETTMAEAAAMVYKALGNINR